MELASMLADGAVALSAGTATGLFIAATTVTIASTQSEKPRNRL